MDETKTDEGHLVSWLAGREVKCPVCDYSLRDLQQPRCPECNTSLHLAVASPNLNMAPWFVAVTSIALGAGFDGVVSVLIMSVAVVSMPGTPAERMYAAALILTFLVMTGVCVTGLVVGYRSRRRWAFWDRRRQWGVAIAVFLATAFGHAAVGGLLIWLIN